MSEQLARLLSPPTPANLRDKLLAQLQGIGWTAHTGFSPGSVTALGTTNGGYNVQVKIIATGDLGVGTFQYSLDGGATWSSTQTLPSSGSFAGAFQTSTNCTLVFANGVSGTPAGTSFVVGDVYQLVMTQTGFAVTSWQTLSVPLSLVENDAQALADLYTLVSLIAQGGFVSLAAAAGMSDWVDLVAQQVYSLTRSKGIPTKGLISLKDAGGTGPHVQTAASVVVASGTLRFINDAGFTLAQNGTSSIAFTAESAGSQYNLGNNTVTTLISTIAGVTVSNPDPGTGTWITQNGTDDESDQALATRCLARWPQLGVASPTTTYDALAKQGSASVTKTAAIVDPTVPGQVDLYLAGSSGPVSGGVVSAVQTYVQPRVPLCVTVLAASAANFAVTVQGVVSVAQAQSAQAQAAVNAALAQLINNTPISGKLRLSAVIAAIQESVGVDHVQLPLTAPTTDITLAATQVATLTNSLTYVSV